ncbi:MAG: hypothetical protein JJT94_14175 [Bernardetiaceae bacterium]|nr:hypothetical protein [Bernardetiaceae bacterium]
MPVAKPEILQENHYYPFGMSLVGVEELDFYKKYSIFVCKSYTKPILYEKTKA